MKIQIFFYRDKKFDVSSMGGGGGKQRFELFGRKGR